VEVKLGYKQTEVGVIPEDWDLKTLGSLTSLLTNGFVGTATSAYVDGDDGVLYIQGYNVQENGFNFHGIKRVSKSFHTRNKSRSRFILETRSPVCSPETCLPSKRETSESLQSCLQNWLAQIATPSSFRN
jgi:hypothetical protein